MTDDQLQLIDLETVREDAARLGTTEGEYTGMYLQRHEPRLYGAIIRMLGAGMGIRQIARLTSTGIKTVQAVRNQEPAQIATVKERLSERLMQVAALAAEAAGERLTEESVDASLRDLMISAGIAVEKGMLLGGEATQRVEINDRRPEHEDYLATVKEVEAEVEGTGLPAETSGQKALSGNPEESDGQVDASESEETEVAGDK